MLQLSYNIRRLSRTLKINKILSFLLPKITEARAKHKRMSQQRNWFAGLPTKKT